jgi:anti-sigma factor RsiW
MKDTRFIELVNLYVDRQISADETAELEAEIQASPRRRQVYHQYCHMHRATRLVYESFRAHADQPAGGAAQPGSIAYFAQRRQRVRRTFWLSTAGGVAAAACVALYVTRAQIGPAPSLPAPAVAVALAPPKLAAATAEMPDADTKAGVQADYAALLSAVRQVDSRNFAFNQSQPVRPVSLFDDGVFDAKTDLTSGRGGVFQTKAATGSRAPAEFTAFQFQR